MVFKYDEGRWICEGSGRPGGIGEAAARRYFRDVVAGLMCLHSHNIVHRDIKPEKTFCLTAIKGPTISERRLSHIELSIHSMLSS